MTHLVTLKTLTFHLHIRQDIPHPLQCMKSIQAMAMGLQTVAVIGGEVETCLSLTL